MKLILRYILCLTPLLATAQLEGYVYDEKEEPVPFATIFLQNHQLGTMSDENGYYYLPVPQDYLPDSLIAQHVAYTPKHIYIETQGVQKIYLKENIEEITTVDVLGLKASSLLKKSIESIAINYPATTHYTNGDYTQIHKENGKYARYIEVFTSIENISYDRRKIDEQKQQFSIIEMRRSANYERNGDQHGDHLYDLMAENPLQNNNGSILNENNVPLYTVHYDNSFDSLGFSKLVFQNKSWNLDKNYKGEIIINTTDFAIVALLLQSFPNTQSTRENKSNWKFQNGVYSLNFEKIGNTYQLQKCTKWYNHHIVDAQGNTDYVVEEFFDWKTEHYLEPSGLKYSKLSNLYSGKYEYDKEYWKDKIIMNDIVEDLSKNKTLEEQFQDD